MSGRRIDDHKSPAGMPGRLALPEGNKVHQYHSSEGSGHVGTIYPDTSELIQRDQMHGDGKTKSHAIKPGYRN